VPTATGLRLITIATIDWAIFARLERHLRFTTATCARCGIHRTRLAVAEAAAATTTLAATTVIRATTGLLARRPALGATARCIGQTTAGIKFLLACGKSEFLIAVATIQNLIGQGVSRFLTCCTLQQTSVFSVLRTITLINFLVETPEFIFSSNICTLQHGREYTIKVVRCLTLEYSVQTERGRC
jgi:hypothetical protein